MCGTRSYQNENLLLSEIELLPQGIKDGGLPFNFFCDSGCEGHEINKIGLNPGLFQSGIGDCETNSHC